MVNHVKRRAALAKCRVRRLRTILRPNSGLTLENRMRILNSVALPSARYGEEVWIRGSNKAKELVTQTQNILARRCSGAPWFLSNRDMREELKLEDMTAVAEERRTAAITRLKKHQSEGSRGSPR